MNAPAQSSLTRVSDDDRLILMWLHDRPEKTQEAYRRDVEQFRKFLEFAPMRTLTLEDIQRYISHLNEQKLKTSTKRRKINSIKSLFSFATKLGYTQFNVTTAIKLPKSPAILAQRILKPIEVMRLIDREENPRNRAFMRLLYVTGARVSEVCRLTWRDLQVRADGQVQAAIVGKGEKARIVLIPMLLWLELEPLRGDAGLDKQVFGIGRKMGHVIIKQAAKRANLDPKVSCHWLRHAHAQHSLANGAPLQLVRDTLGHSSIAVTNWYLEAMPGDSSSKYLGL